jgi:hypothetical protein
MSDSFVLVPRWGEYDSRTGNGTTDDFQSRNQSSRRRRRMPKRKLVKKKLKSEDDLKRKAWNFFFITLLYSALY